MMRLAMRVQPAWLVVGLLFACAGARAGVITEADVPEQPAVPATPAPSAPAATSVAAPLNVFSFTSSAASWVGHGLTQSNAISSVQRHVDAGAYTNAIEFFTAGGWDVAFAAPSLGVLSTGSYANALRWPFNDNHPGLSFTGNGRGDNTLTGQFNVLDLTYNTDGSVLSFAADFTQYDEGKTTWWNTGQLRYNSTVPLPEPATLLPSAAVALIALRRRRRLP